MRWRNRIGCGNPAGSPASNWRTASGPPIPAAITTAPAVAAAARGLPRGNSGIAATCACRASISSRKRDSSSLARDCGAAAGGAPLARGSTSWWPYSLAPRWRAQRAASQPSRLAATSASSNMMSSAGSPRTASNLCSACSTAGSRITSTTSGAALRTSPSLAAPGSSTAATSAPAAMIPASVRSRALPGRVSNTTRLRTLTTPNRRPCVRPRATRARCA